jgi:hypothetical protein
MKHALVKTLGDGELEEAIRKRVKSLLRSHPGISASVLGFQQNDNWEVIVQHAANQKSWAVKLTLHDNQSVERIIKFVSDGIAAVE